MAHKCEYTMRFYVDYEKQDLVRVTTAHWKNKQLDVYREFLKSGEVESRNLYFASLGGWLVTFPGEKNKRSYFNYYGYKQELEEWAHEVKTDALMGKCEQSIEDIKIMLFEVDSKLFYFCKKLSNYYDTYSKLFELVRIYLAHPECETLIQYGFYDLALNKSLYKLSKKKLKEVLIICLQTIILKDLRISLM